MNTEKIKPPTQDELQLLEQNIRLSNQQSLITRLLSMEDVKNDALTTFDRLVREDFWQLSAALGQPTARQDYLALSAITQELQLIIGLPDIHTKSIVGICGGFSSGKSALINSFIQPSGIRLTEGVNPVTAVASYVTHHPLLQMRAYSNKGSSCVLSPEHYQQLDHEAQKDAPIDLQRLMSCITIGVPMVNKKIFSNLCLIDTPGYNPKATGTKAADHKTAFNFAKQSDALIWVMSVEQGTLPQSDLDFIEAIKNNGFAGKLYIVINKADLKSKSDCEDILLEVIDQLDCQCLDYEGVSLYSASRKKELSYHQLSLLDFLSTCRTSKPVFDGIREKINAIFGKYLELIAQKSAQKSAQTSILSSQLKSLRLDIMQGGDQDMLDTIMLRLDRIQSEINKHIKPKTDKKIENQIEALRTNLMTQVYRIEHDTKKLSKSR